MSERIDPYKILGVSRDATFEEVRKAYRRAATKYHPDAGGDAWVFQQVQQAFDILREQFERGGSGAVPVQAEPKQERRSASPNPQDKKTTGSTNRKAEDYNRKQPHSSEGRIFRTLGPIELAGETGYFVLANFMDLVMTLILLRVSAVEANPVAAYVYHRFGFVGMIGLKVLSVLLVCAIAQIIAKRSRLKARGLLIGGTLLVSAVVVYSMFLARSQIHFR